MFLSRKTGKPVELTGCAGYPVAEQSVQPPLVVPRSVLCENSKSCITQHLPHSCKYVYINSSEVYESCKYNDSNIVDVRSVKKENKINVKTTFVNNYDGNNTVDVRNVNKLNKVKGTSVNNHNNYDNRELQRVCCYACLCKES